MVRALYDSNDASRFGTSLNFFADDARLSMWAEGVQGCRVARRELVGKAQIRAALSSPGLRRTTDRPDGLRYHETGAKVMGDRGTFMLEPDRLRPNGRAYSPYRVDALVSQCRIRALTLIEYVTWL